MEDNPIDVNVVMQHKLNTLEFGHVVKTKENCHRFLRAHGVLADGSYCRRCRVSSVLI